MMYFNVTLVVPGPVVEGVGLALGARRGAEVEEKEAVRERKGRVRAKRALKINPKKVDC